MTDKEIEKIKKENSVLDDRELKPLTLEELLYGKDKDKVEGGNS